MAERKAPTSAELERALQVLEAYGKWGVKPVVEEKAQPTSPPRQERDP